LFDRYRIGKYMSSDDKSPNALLRVGVIGTIVAALCCFTPVLVVLFGAVGLAAVVGYLDAVLFPALGIFILLTIYALWRKNARNSASQRN
jgi:mercuric ion transport protein